MANILSIGQTALAAAQIGINTTGNNIANANTPGYSRQVIVQTTAPSQGSGSGFIGKGTEVTGIQRVYSQYLSDQVTTAQTSQGQLDTYYSQIQQVNNMFADSTVGLSPTLQDFFNGIQGLAADPASGAARQTMLSSADTLASQFQSLDGKLSEMRQGVNTQISASIDSINGYAQQIAQLNDAIGKATAGSDGAQPNDLLDQRDLAISNLSKEIKVTVVKQGSDYGVFIGNGQPLVVANNSYKLTATQSDTDPTRMEVGYQSNGKTITLAESAISGGNLGGLFSFRSQTLDSAQNSLGRIAIGLATTFNAQHALGQDQTGAAGGQFFTVGTPLVNTSSSNVPVETVTPNVANTGTQTFTSSVANANALTGSNYRVDYNSTTSKYSITRLSDNTVVYPANATFPPAAAIDGLTFSAVTGTAPVTGTDSFLVKPGAPAQLAASISNVNALTTSDYQVQYVGPGNYKVTRLSDGAITTSATMPLTVDGVDFSVASGTMAPGNTFLVRPTANGAAAFNVAITDPAKIAAAAPIRTGNTSTNSGSGVISAGSVDANYTAATITPAVTLTYNAAGGTLTGFPSTLPVTVTSNGVAVTGSPFAAGSPVTYTAGATITFGGVSLTLSGTPANGDTFTVGPNSNGVGDNRNALLLGALQTANTLGNSTASYQTAYGQLVNAVGNKTHELQVTSTAQDQLVGQAVAAQQADSGVNLDEEAANLLRYQQAYQAAGKVMQTASKLFDTLLSLGS